MRADRPLLGAAVSLAAGLWMIFFYGTANSGFSAAVPFSNSTLHLDIATTGPAAMGGAVLVAIGVLLLAWAILAAIVWHASLLVGGDRRREPRQERIFEPPEDTTRFITPPATGTSGRRHFL